MPKVGRPKKNTTKRRRNNRPKDLTTKEELIKYLEENQDTENPFVEECWDKAVEKAKENKLKEQPETSVISKDEDGNEIVIRKKVGIVDNPVAMYFRMCSLPAYKKISDKIKKDRLLNNDSVVNIMDVYFDDDDEDDDDEEYEFDEDDNPIDDEITLWIKSLPSNYERKLMKRMYSSYFNQYDINEGVGKSTLKGILSIGLELDRIDRQRAMGENVDYKKEKDLRNTQQQLFDAMKWQPKQRNIREELAANKFSTMMDRMVKEGGFRPKTVETKKDDIDFLIDTLLTSYKRMFDQ